METTLCLINTSCLKWSKYLIYRDINRDTPLLQFSSNLTTNFFKKSKAIVKHN